MTIRVPFFDWAGYFAERRDEFAEIMVETAGRGGFILQRDVDEFERALADFLGIKHVIGLADGTNAILLGLRASGIGPGDEVIIASHAFIAAAQSIHHVGATNVPVELREDDWLVDPEAVAAAVTPRTKAIMAVHVNGRLCAMDRLREIADRHGLELVEDAAQAVGARLDGKPGAAHGRWGTFSFYPSKTLGCFGDAGALATNDDEIAASVRAMRNHGANAEKTISRDVTIWGTNCRLDNIQAAILGYKLTYYPAAIERRRVIAARYNEAFSSIGELRLPPPPDDGRHYDIFQNYEMCSPRRDALRAYLGERGIGTIVQWGGLALHHMAGLGFSQNLPLTDAFFATSLLLPMNHILSDDQVGAVIDAVRSFHA